MVVGRTLITTADERTWPKDKNEPVMFLGEWCKRYNRKHVWEKLDYKVVEYHWNDRAKLHSDFKYLQELYEEILLDLSNRFNDLHNVSHNIRYWRILLGPWLGYFIQILYDRSFMLQYVFSVHNISKCYLLEQEQDSVVPNDMEQFTSLFIDDEWNEAVYAQLIRRYFGGHTKLISVPVKRKISVHRNAKPKSLIKDYLMIGDKIFKKVTRSYKGIFILSSYISMIEKIKLQLRLKYIPKIWVSIAPPQSKINIDIRQRLSRDLDMDNWDFPVCVRYLILQYIPKVYLEGYKSLICSAQKLMWPVKPELIFTSDAYTSDEVFKCWAADKTECKVPLIISQHGGFGLNSFSFVEDHQIKISDKWLSWGFDDITRPQIVPFYNIKPICTKNNYDPNGGVLMVEAVWPRYSYHLYAVPISTQWLNYYHDQKLFINKLPIDMRKKVVVRLHKNDYGWDQKIRWTNDMPDIKLDDGCMDIETLIGRSRLYIATYNATTYLEVLSFNMPTIVFWNPYYQEINEEAVPYFEQLKSVGVFHENPESAAEHMIKIWDNVDAWWKTEKVQNARKIFCERYSRKLDAPVDELKSIFQSVTK